MNIFYLGYFINLLSALILVGLDLPIIRDWIEKLFFKNLNKAIIKLSNFCYTPNSGPSYSKIEKPSSEFHSLIKIIFSYFPNFRSLNKEIIAIYCEEAISFNPTLTRPVSLWLRNNKGVAVCSYLNFIILIENYKKSVLNQVGTAFFLMGSSLLLFQEILH
jgi:hypothetical protein